MRIHIDRPALKRVRWHTNARGRVYYLAEAPILGIIVDRTGQSLDGLADLVLDAAVGNELGVEGWCWPGCAGRRHGKITLYRVVDARADLTVSEVLDTWRRRYQ